MQDQHFSMKDLIYLLRFSGISVLLDRPIFWIQHGGNFQREYSFFMNYLFSSVSHIDLIYRLEGGKGGLIYIHIYTSD